MGSELNTLLQANYFSKRGNEVDIYTLEIDEPLKNEVSNKIRLIDHYHEEMLFDHYDLVIARQWPLLEYLLFQKKIVMDRVYYEAVSWRLPIDFFPYFYEDLTLVGYVSRRIKNILEQLGYNTANAYYFPNSADCTFFETKPECHNADKQEGIPQNIVIVSNHVPKELEEFAHIAQEQSNINVDIFGKHHDFKLVTPELLKKYDLIISVGKTIFYGLAMGIPCYSYDETSSIGYINCMNYKDNLDDNFASSNCFSPKTPIDLLHDIEQGYKVAFKDSLQLKKRAQTDFSFEAIMDKFVKKLETLPKMNLEAIYKKYPLSQELSKVYVDEVSFYRADVKRWYNESIKLGNMLRESQRVNSDLKKDIEKIYDSKTWKAISHVKKTLYCFEKILGKQSYE